MSGPPLSVDIDVTGIGAAAAQTLENAGFTVNRINPTAKGMSTEQLAMLRDLWVATGGDDKRFDFYVNEFGDEGLWQYLIGEVAEYFRGR